MRWDLIIAVAVVVILVAMPVLRVILGETKDISDWHRVRFDDEQVFQEASPPGRKPWTDSFEWTDVTRVCLKTEDGSISEGLYVFTKRRIQSHAIPMDAVGAEELWDEILKRGLFDANLAIDASEGIGQLFCWPPDESSAVR